MYEQDTQPNSMPLYKSIPLPHELERQRESENGIASKPEEKTADTRIQQYLENYD